MKRKKENEWCIKTVFYSSLCMLFLLCGVVSTWSQVLEENVDKIINVDKNHLLASDNNSGTWLLPLKTIGKAAQMAEENNKKNIGTKILIYPGIYREKISLPFNGEETGAPIIFEAEEKGKVIISGSEIWTGWKKLENPNIYIHSWPYKWGLAPYPPDWQDKVELQPIVRRKEMIFVDVKLQEQVLSLSELKEGSFYVSEEEETVYLWLPEGKEISNSKIEVAIRSGLLHVKSKTNIVLRGLRFIHDNTPVDGGSINFRDSSNILVEDCEFIWNNWDGLSFNGSQNVTVRRSVANHNGGPGMSAAGIKNLLFEDNETSYNNWRGAMGEYYGWSVAGIKSLLIHDGIYRRHKSVGNQAYGFWLDTDCANVIIEDSFWRDNLTNGVFIEASQGPITIRKSKICYNEKAGVLASNSSNVTLENNIIYGNGNSQIKVAGISERLVTNFETGEQVAIKSQDWTLRGNIIASNDSSQFLFYIVDWIDWENFISTLTSGDNLWYSPDNERPFKVDGTDLDFNWWKSTTGQELDSTFNDPQFENHDNLCNEN